MKNRTMLLIYVIWTVLLGAGEGIWLYTLMDKYYDASTNAFNASNSALLPFKIFLAFSVALAAVIAVLPRKSTSKSVKFPKAIYTVTAAIFAFSGVASAVLMLTNRPSAGSRIFIVLTWLCIFAAFASAAHFCFKALGKNDRAEYFSLSLPLWAIFAIASSYFNSDFTYTNFIRTLLSLVLAAVLLFFLAYVRELLGKKYSVLKALSSAAALILGISYITARLIYVLKNGGFLLSDALEAALIGAMIFIAVSAIYEKKPTTAETPAEIIENDDASASESDGKSPEQTEE